MNMIPSHEIVMKTKKNQKFVLCIFADKNKVTVFCRLIENETLRYKLPATRLHATDGSVETYGELNLNPCQVKKRKCLNKVNEKQDSNCEFQPDFSILPSK